MIKIHFNSIVILVLGLVLFSCNAPKKKLKFAIIQYSHETCTFCPGGDTTIQDWTKRGPFVSGKDVLKSGGYNKGFVHQASLFNDVEIVGINSPDYVFGGSSRSWNTKESFEHFMSIILTDLKSKMPVDAVQLTLHGAMAVRDVPRPEAEIAKRVRELVGPNVPISATFDLHGNEDKEFLKWADAAFVTKRYPHYDASLQGERSANFLYRAVKNKYKSTTATRKPKILTSTVQQWTGKEPSSKIMERARRWENRNQDVFVSVFYGFPWSDVPDIGATVHVITNNNQELADSIANDMNSYFNRLKKEFAGGSYPLPKEAIEKTKEAIKKEKTPITLGDYSDRQGDATWIIKELIDKKVEKFLIATLRDENVLKKLSQNKAKIGEKFNYRVGGFTGEQAGEPVKIEGEIIFFGPHFGYEKVAVVKFSKGGNVVIIVPTYEQVIRPSDIKFGDLNPDDFDVIVVKSRVHFRRGFDETGYSKTVFVVDAPGDFVGTTRLSALEYKYGPINELYPFNQN
jgi:microcystin degradation protein MlrC